MENYVIDAFEFCRLGERREGELALSDLPRLAREVVGVLGPLRWSLQGGRNQHGHPQLALLVNDVVQLRCQRCLQPFEQEIASESVLVLARDEASADELDVMLADEPVEVIVGSHSFNVLQLVEDEVLLALPISPRHEVCPAPPVADTLLQEKKDSPFSVLKNLKK